MPIAALGSLVGSALTNVFNAGQNEEQRKWSEKMWNAQNEYNTPANQMKRLRSAGINPHFAIAGGQLGTGNASSQASMTSPTPYDFSPIGEGVARSVELFQQKRMQDSEIGLKNAQAENQRLQNITQLYRDLETLRNLRKSGNLTEQQNKNLVAQEHEIWTNIQSLSERNEVEIDKARSETYLNNALERKERLTADYQEIVNQFEVPNRKKILRNLDAEYDRILSAAAAGNASAAASYADAALKGVEKNTAEKIQKYVVDKAFQEVESIKDRRELDWLRSGFEFWGDIKRVGNTEARERVGEGYYRAKKQSGR